MLVLFVKKSIDQAISGALGSGAKRLPGSRAEITPKRFAGGPRRKILEKVGLIRGGSASIQELVALVDEFLRTSRNGVKKRAAIKLVREKLLET